MRMVGSPVVPARSRAGAFAAALAVLLALSFSAHAATTYTWNIAGSGNWSTNTNWTPVGIPVAGDTVNINAITAGSTITLTANSACDTLKIATTNNFTIAGAFTFSVATAISDTAASGTHTISSNLVLTNNNSWTITPTLVCSGVVSGAFTINKLGAGTVIFSGANTYSGATTISAGTLQIGNAGATGTLGTVGVTNNAALVFNRTAALTVANVISGTGSVTQNGTATITFSGTNTYSGATIINTGTFQAGSTQSFGVNSAVTLANAAAAVLNITGFNNSIGSITGGGGTGGNVTLGAATLTIGGDNTSPAAYAGVISGTGAITKSGTGTLTLSGGNTYSGITTISAGTLQIGSTGATGTLGTGAVTDNAALVFNRNNSMTVANAISGTGTLTQAGTGTSILTGANTYSGITTISAGTLQVGAAGVIGTLGTGTVTDNGALVFNRTDVVTIGNTITGTGSLQQAGSGTIKLTAANGYTGATSVTAGILLVDGSIAAGSATTVSAGALLGGTGAANGSVTVAGTLSAGDPDTNPETLNTGVLSFSAGSAMKVQINSATVGTGYDQIAVTGAANLANCTLNLTLGYVPLNGDAFTILTSTGALTNTFANYANNAIFALNGQNFQITYNANSVVITRLVATYIWNGGGGNANWTTAANWVGGVAPGTGDNLIFGAAGALQKANTNNYAAATTFGSIQFMDSGYTLSGNSVTLSGGATALNNNFAGANTVSIALIFATNAPTISCLAGGTLTITTTINNGGLPLTVASDGATAANGIISGAAGLTNTGAGVLTLGAANTFTGVVTINGGQVSIGADARLGNAANTVTLAGGALGVTATFTSARNFALGAGDGGIDVGAGFTLTLSGVISGANSLTKTNTGVLVLSGTNTFGGAAESLTIAGGTLQISAAAQLGDPATTVTVGDGTTFTITAITNVNNPMTFGAGVAGVTINIPNNTTSATPIVLTGVISGGSAGQTFNFTGNSDAWLSLAGANTYIANLSMANATNLEFNSDSSFGDPANTLIMTNNNAIAAIGATTFTGNRAININNSFFLSNPGTVWINSGVVSGPNLNVGYSDAAGSFTGTVELSGNNTFTGTIAVWCGTLALANNNALGAPGSITVNGNTFNRAAPPANAALMIDGNVTIPQNITTTGNGVSTNTLGSLSGTTGTFGGTVAMGSNTFFAAAPGSTVTFSNVISGAVAITAGSPTATGTLVFTTAETYTGTTTVSGGTLRLKGDTGTLATTSLTLNQGGAFDIDASGVANPNRLADAMTVTFNGGTFSIEAPANTDRTETVTQLTFAAGDNTISLTPNGTGRARLAATNAFSRTSGATLNYIRNTGGGTGLAHLTSAAQAAGSVTYATVTVAGVTSPSTYDTTNATDGLVNGLTVAAPIYISQAPTDWNTAATWTPAGPPTAGSVAIVQHAVTVNNTPANVPFSIVFDVGGSLTTTAGAARTVTVGAGGFIARTGTTATIGGGAIQLTVASSTAELIAVTAGTGSLTINNPILNTNTPALTKSGTGTLKLTAVNAYTGVTTVNNGFLLVDGSIAAGSAVSLTGGTLGGTGTVFGTVTASALGGAISPGDPDSNPGILTTGAVTLNALADLNIQLNGPVVGTNYDQLSVTGAINLGGSSLNSTVGVGYFPVNGTAFTIISSTGAVSGTFAGLPNNTTFPISGQNFKITYNANSVVLTRIVGTYIWNGAGINNNWSTGFNWVGGVAPGVGDSLLFGAAGAARKTTDTNDIAAATSFNSIQFQSAGYILNGNSVMLSGGATALNYSATPGTNTINNAITFAAAAPTITTLAGGTLNLNGAIDNGGLLLTLASAGSTTIAGAISNTGALTSTGAGAVILSGANSYGGTTTISAGSLQVGNAGLTGTLGTGTVTDNASLIFNRTNALTVASAISGTGTLTQAGTGTTILTGANSYSGITTISAGTLQIGNAGVTGTLGTAGVTDNGALVFNRTDNISVSNVVSGTGSLTQAGSGTLTLSGTNSYTGATSVTAGILSVASLANGGVNSNIGASTNAAANLLLNGGTLQFTGAATTTDRLFSVGLSNGTIDASGTGALNFSNAGAMGFNAAAGARTLTLTGTNAGSNILAAVVGDNGGATTVVKSNTGTWIFTGANAYTGTTTISAGTLQIGNAGATGTLGTGAVTDSGALIFNRTAALGVSNVIGGAGTLTQNGTGTVTLSGTNTYTGATAVNVGILKAGVATQAFGVGSAVTLANVAGVTLDITGFNNTVGSLAGGGALGGNVTLGAATLTAGGNNGTTTFAGILSGAGGDLTKAGTGTMTLSGVNTYTGNTTVNAGTLKAGVATQAFGVNSAVTMANTAGAILDITGFSNTIGSLTGGGAAGGNITLGAATLTVGSDNTSPAVYAGVIAGTGFLAKTGTGTLTLSGTSTFTGGTTVAQGAISVGTVANVSTDQPLGHVPLVTLGSNTQTGTLELTGNTSPSSTMPFTLAAGGTGAFQIDTATNVLTLSGVISSTGALSKTGPGILTLSGTDTYSGTTTVNAGTLLVDGSLAAGSAVSINATATLGGTGTINGTVTGAGGTLSPGDPETNPGTLRTGVTSFSSASTFKVQLNGTGAGSFDVLAVTGTLNLTNATLSATCGYTAANGDTFTIMTSTGARSNLFTGLANNQIFPISGQNFKITYNANTVVLTRVIGNYIWNGAGANDNWSTGANWVGGVAPGAGDTLTFGNAGAARKTTTTDDLAAGTNFNAINFTDAGYTLSGNSVTLTGGAAALNYSATAGTNTINNNLAFSTAAPTITTFAGGTLNVAGTINNGGLLLSVASAGATNLNGSISNSGGIASTAAGSLTLAAAENYTGTTSVSAGTVFANGSLVAGAGLTTVANAATLSGTGSVNALTVSSGGIVMPGTPAATGILSAAGNTLFSAGALYAPLINGTTLGSTYDQLNVTGTLNITGATLNVSVGPGIPTTGVTNNFYTVMTSTAPIVGTFNGIPEGGLVMSVDGTQGFTVSYLGNAVTLHQVPVLLSAQWIDGLGSSNPGVDAGDTVVLTFSIPVKSTGALISEIGVPVTGDTFDTSVVVSNATASTTVTITLAGLPQLTPGGTYSPLGTVAGSPTGVYIVSGIHLKDTFGNATYSYPTSAAGTAAAVDLLPGGAGVLSVSWDDTTITPRIWDMGSVDLSTVVTASTNTPVPVALNLVNTGTVRQQCTISCSKSVPSGWSVAAAPGPDQFEMQADNSVPLTGVFGLNLSTPQILTSSLYSGQYKAFDLRLTTPSALTKGAGTQQTITVTIVVTQN